ncbi:DUF7825 domain-containing protein [Nonomuraea sp. LPB2021202275-12-8]|uniref:DUF7825 domain-containing protein n=1 Tax=Nonomuraea sp. LPB2021202275-12-8 TaxID=3120159 RepID=UPI00300C177D
MADSHDLPAPWIELLKLVRAGDTARTVHLLARLDAAGRKAIAAELPRYVTAQSRERNGWWDWHEQFSPLIMAGVACLGGAAAVAAWVFRREFRWRKEDARDPGWILELVRDRPEAWRADVARRMVGRLRPLDTAEWEIVAALVRETAIEPPAGDAFVIGWLLTLDPRSAGADPLFAHLAPRIFEPAGLAEAFSARQIWAVGQLVADGLLERADVIDGLVGRLLRDGPSGPVALADLHERLQLDLVEAAGRARDYVRLLPAAPVPVADMALAQLKRLDGAGRLEEELFAEAVEGLAFRPEKKLLRAAVSWAGEAVTRVPGRTDAALSVLATIFRQDVLDLQERAVRLAVRLAGQAGEQGRAAVIEAAGGLPDGLREQISMAYGETIAEEVAVAASLVAGPGPRPLPPIASPEELAQEIVAMGWPLGVHAFERILAGLVEWADREPQALREALRPWGQLDRAQFGFYGHDVIEGGYELLRRVVHAFAAPEDSAKLSQAIAQTRRRQDAGGPLDGLFQQRARELIAPFESGAGYPVLLAAPTSGTGHVDPETLLDRLERLEAAGVEALPADLAQALLRLPRGIDQAIVERAGKLTSDAGRACAAWLASGGPADPQVTCWVSSRRAYHGGDYKDVHAELSLSLPDPLAPFHELFAPGTGHTYTLEWWPSAMPSHREVVAAHLAPYLPASLESNDRQVVVLASLAHGDGPVGTAMGWALACGMGHRNAADRAAATDALLTLAARGEVPAAALGEAVAELTAEEIVKLNRVISALDEATQAGAHAAVWAVIADLLPRLLPAQGERPRSGLADLLAAGARAARTAGARGDIPELAAVAARKGSSRLVQEARRLHHLLTQ